MNSSGNAPCTASDEPVFSAIADISAPTARARIVPPSAIVSTPATPPLIDRPNGNRMAMKKTVWKAPYTMPPASRPTMMPDRVEGELSSRSKKPFSMSTASAVAPTVEPNRIPWTTEPASAKSRKESTSGNPGTSVVARENDDVPSAAKNSGKISDGMTSDGWRNRDRIDRFESARVWATCD